MSARDLEIVVLSGPSGSGKTAALHALEDIGFYCVDNLPTALLPDLVALAEANPGTRRVALVIDVRERAFHGDVEKVLDQIGTAGSSREVTYLYLDCDDVTLTNRFKTTRRPHPLVAQGAAATLDEALTLERALLAPFREHAGARVIDTAQSTVHTLRRLVHERFALPGTAPGTTMALQLLSFGFHAGVPPESDFVFDVRFLDNPFFVRELRELTGKDTAVESFVMGQPAAGRTLAHIVQLLDDVLGPIVHEGRASLTIAIGCTGGRHRSVAMVEALGRELAARGHAPLVRHRDLAG